MSDIAILKEMIKESATVPLEEEQNGKRLNYSVTLTEPQHNYYVTINGMPNDDLVIVIKADAFSAPTNIFTSSKGQCKRADFIIIADTPTEKVIFCIEMKKTKDQKTKIIQQLTGAKCLVEYCKEIGKSFWNRQDFLDNYQYRFISIGHIRVPKGTTRSKPLTETHDHPDRMLIITNTNKLQFAHLIYGRKN